MIDFNTSFDSLFHSSVSHYANYPEMLPFVGINWDRSAKVLLIGESHYLPFDEIAYYSNIDYFKNWYNENSKALEDHHKGYINTRKNFQIIESGEFARPLMIYYNLQKAILELEDYAGSDRVFQNFSYYNYFQKPAYIQEIAGENRSIKADKKDKEVAFKVFQRVVDVLKPRLVIFVSKSAFNAFSELKFASSKDFKSLTINVVPHAGRSWWNRTSKQYDNLTGKEKFKKILGGHLLTVRT